MENPQSMTKKKVNFFIKGNFDLNLKKLIKIKLITQYRSKNQRISQMYGMGLERLVY